MPRQARAEVVQTERRRRTDDTLNRVFHLKLAIPAHLRDDKEHEYRWINDDNNRINDLTVEDDWNICDDKGGGQISKVVGTKDGKPLVAFLARKKKEFYDEDKRREAARVAGQEQEMLRAPPTDGSQASATNYVASGSSIKRGAYAP